MRTVTTVFTLATLAAAPPALAAKAPAPPRLVKPADMAQIKKNPKGITFSVRARAHERPGKLGIELRTAEEGDAPDGRYYNPFEDESGPIDQFALKPVKPGGTLYSVRVPNSEFHRLGVSDFFWHAYRKLPRSQCRRMKSGKLDCFEESKTRTFDYNVF